MIRREFVLLARGHNWHLLNENATDTRCSTNYCIDIAQFRKVLFTDTIPRPLCKACAQGAVKLLADMARYNRQPNLLDTPSILPHSENLPKLIPFCEITTITKVKEE